MEGLAIELAPNEKRCSKCKEVKDRGEFYYSRLSKDKLAWACKICKKFETNNWYQNKKLSNNTTLIECPICNLKYSELSLHAKLSHKLDKTGLKDFGIEITSTKDSFNKRSKAHSKPKPFFRKGEFAELINGSIDFPKSFWPETCKYVSVKVLKDKNKILFNPKTTPDRKTKTITDPKSGSLRLQIKIHHQIADSLSIIRPMYKLRKGAGFFIDLEESDKALLDSFSIWANSGHSFKNQNHLTVFHNKPHPSITVNEIVWPLNAEYCFLEWVESKRKNVPNYLDIYPVSRTGFIVGGSDNSFKQFIDLSECFKVGRVHRRLKISPIKFLRNNNIPASDWDLKEVLPSGALRFRMYRERQPKEQLEEIAS